ncbi:cold-shock protein [Actinoallomurus iriomotensis]|uniref:DNA-binding protein n=1 Tax=Actinoallomurus iriomotensis TaxID=478107 RepID=A0A9W6RL14_9ACTN|nr:cold shock domain-containing protein [Actinoallomurus iriomotensis]GLY77643.1 DNA-binding protein [Actinoallomurus iriomotensis]
MAAGSIVRFDEVRGYGFIAPEGGGEDVFVHANDLVADKALYKVGARVEFDISEGDRGLKASTVRLVRQSGPPSRRGDLPDADELCDVLSAGEFTQDITEVLLRVPSLTGEQILQLRRHLLELARDRGWVDS